ncbi:six-Cys-in-45 modification radical SAM protein [Desulfitobacterium dichloroeliminans LMG P-21439]|uniref:Six-Cys-in-45 modification radical SAM protein n=1 Tax=Desulfitobacterium dichloroeliminans (strain LMG P-21439 / DCA1) TaxID=871963 RepID=L0FE02_DESDL|nr:thioether cross-link-forming SCIFF peptide maturase [Desulfitobacterium dichloroeliminans]AGA70881.1 six-Cys-in-45 modification radical SAM protein [Desulfitobacterium dichloroeliminans LMG P-21439]
MFLEGYEIRRNVHTYRQGDLNIAYDVNSGSLHILDDLTFAIVKVLEKLQEKGKPLDNEDVMNQLQTTEFNLSHEEVKEILSEMEQLQKEGILFSKEAEEKGPSYPAKPIVKAICLHVAHDCNLRCNYCFAGTGAFGGQRGLMDWETGKKAIDFVLEASAHRKHCEVDFFGGEPLLNFQVVKDLVDYGKKAAQAKGKTIKFTLTTNAVLLTEDIQNFLEEEDISVVLSIDGRPEVHDRMRPYANGRGSYDQVAPRLQQFAKKRPDSSPYAVGTYYYARGTYTHYNLDFDEDVTHLLDLGMKQISLEPVVAQPSDPYAFQEGDLPEILKTYDRLGEELLERRKKGEDFSFFHFNVALDKGPCLPKRLSGCGAGHEYVAISPEGDLYPCHQFVGQEEFKMGSLNEEKPSLNLGIVDKFRSAHVYSKSSCRQCWARFSCSGGCHSANQAFSGHLNDIYELGCELQKKRLEVALYMKIKEASLIAQQ